MIDGSRVRCDTTVPLTSSVDTQSPANGSCSLKSCKTAPCSKKCASAQVVGRTPRALLRQMTHCALTETFLRNFCKSVRLQVTNMSGRRSAGPACFKEHHVQRVFLSIAFGLVVLAILSGSTFAADKQTLRTRTDRLVKPYLDNDIVVGLTIGILRDGKKEVFGYGRMSRDDRRVPDGNTIYELGSATKVMTGILLADAVVQGKLKLDQPATELLPENVKMPSNGPRDVTLQDLATHVSGLPRIPDNMKVANPDNPYADYREEELYSFLNDHQLAHAPGKQSEYSNLGMGLLGHLLSLQSKSTYEELVRNRIAQPLKMTNTTITIESESRTRFATGYTIDGKPATNWDIPVLAGAGGIRTTVNDLMLFAAANLTPPKSDLGAAIEMAWAIHQPPIEKDDSPIGLGWHVMPDGTHWHNGETGGYHSIILINRKAKTSVVVLANTATQEIDQLGTDLLRMLSGAQVSPRKFEKPIDVPPEAFRKLLGNYELAPGIEVSVKEEEGKLMVTLTGQPSLQVYARSETVWFYKVVDATITFNLDQKGQCHSLVISQEGVKQTARRKRDPAELIPTFVGRYELPSGAAFTVENEEGKLMIGLTDQPSYEVFPRSETVWYYKVVDATITFNLDKNGKCDSLVLFQNGIKQTAKRKKDQGEPLPQDETTVDIPIEVQQKFAGRYELKPGILFTVEVKDDKLMIGLTGQPSHQIYPRSKTVWFYKVVDATITFNLDKNGKCDSLVLFQNGIKQTAKRKK